MVMFLVGWDKQLGQVSEICSWWDGNCYEKNQVEEGVGLKM